MLFVVFSHAEESVSSEKYSSVIIQNYDQKMKREFSAK